MKNNIAYQLNNMDDKVIAPRFLESDNFLRETKKYRNQLEPYLDCIQRKVNEIGLEYLTSKKNEKMLSNTKDKIFEFRCDPIKGHRIFFKYGWQLNNTKLKINKHDIILCRYVEDHDNINKAANSIPQNLLIDFRNIKGSDFQIVPSDLQTEENKIYIHSKDINHLIPILDKDQANILNCKEQYIFVNGIAGSGKTNLCIQKILFETISNKRVIYSTFSRKLLNSTQEIIYYNYLNGIMEIIDELSKNGINQNIVYKINNLNLNIDLDNDVETIVKNLNEMYNKINSVQYLFLNNICCDGHKDKKLVDLKIFSDLIKSNAFTYDLKNKFQKSDISIEILFKEIEGVVLGLTTDNEIISYNEYKNERNNVFNDRVLHIIYSIANNYLKYIKSSNKYIDKNLIANKIIKTSSLEQIFDYAILDEVQDFTQKELLAFKHIANNVFAVGDPLQMINPSYFSFNKLKQLYGENHKEFVLDLNYRNTKPLNNAINALLIINKEKLGSHSKILREVKTADIQESTYLFFTNQNEVFEKLNNSEFNDYSIVVADEEDKKNYKNFSKEILTISEIKGLERGTIVLHNILTIHQKEWQELDNVNIDKKNADENSLLRYYFNIFYVCITRAQRHLLVVEDNEISIFKNFFKENFTYLEKESPIELLKERLELSSLTDEQRSARINEALKNNLLDNVLHHINWIKDEKLKKKQEERYVIYEEYFQDKNTQKVRDKFIYKNLIEDAIAISKQNKEFDIANLLNNIFFESKLNISLCYDILIKNTTDKVRDVISMALAKSRNDIIENNNILKDILKEI